MEAKLREVTNQIERTAIMDGLSRICNKIEFIDILLAQACDEGKEELYARLIAEGNNINAFSKVLSAVLR